MVRATPLRAREASTAVPQARMDFQTGAGKGAWADMETGRGLECGKLEKWNGKNGRNLELRESGTATGSWDVEGWKGGTKRKGARNPELRKSWTEV